jgi:hypothetical protein
MTISGHPSGDAASMFEDIFTSYSERTLTQLKDRPYAIAGLERRLIDLYRTESSHGIVHCCFGKSLLWQRSRNERMKRIEDYRAAMIPSWSWMKYEGKIRYGNIPKVNTCWNRDIRLTSTRGPRSNSQERRVLAASLVRIPQGCHIEPWPDTSCKIKDTNDRLVGWIKFDDEDEVNIGRLGCIIIAQHKFSGWTGFKQDSWKDFAGISWEEKLEPSNLFYVLVVTQAAHEQGYEVEVYHRLGVAVVQGEYLSLGKLSQAVWVI